jgi:hypothetical protein
MPDRLPGFGASRRHRYRNERGVDALARWLRDLQQYGPYEEALIILARTTAASLDRLEHQDDLDRSEHTVGNVARVHLQVIEALRPNMIPAGDSFDTLIDELSTALRDPPPT